MARCQSRKESRHILASFSRNNPSILPPRLQLQSYGPSPVSSQDADSPSIPLSSHRYHQKAPVAAASPASALSVSTYHHDLSMRTRTPIQMHRLPPRPRHSPRRQFRFRPRRDPVAVAVVDAVLVVFRQTVKAVPEKARGMEG